MSTNFLYQVQGGRQEPDQAVGHVQSDFRPYKLSMRVDGIENPVTLIRTISRMGVGLKKAHDVVSHITDGEIVQVELVDAGADLSRILGKLGVEATLAR